VHVLVFPKQNIAHLLQQLFVFGLTLSLLKQVALAGELLGAGERALLYS